MFTVTGNHSGPPPEQTGIPENPGCVLRDNDGAGADIGPAPAPLLDGSSRPGPRGRRYVGYGAQNWLLHTPWYGYWMTAAPWLKLLPVTPRTSPELRLKIAE